jgi:hypothetical protein
MINPANGNKHLRADAQMAFNQSGTIGYVVGLGIDINATDENTSLQPLIWKMDKTTSSAATWTQMPNIDFRNNNFPMVTDHLAGHKRPLMGDTIGLPYTYDYDITVDMHGKLHIGIIFMSGFSDHPDSLTYVATYDQQFHNNPGEEYYWIHAPGNRPYIYDFIGDGVTNWQCVMVDSASSEGPSAAPAGNGYLENPWDNTGEGGAKIGMDTRLQLGRTPTGDYITYSWSESDSAITNGQLKWNNMPNIKARSMKVYTNMTYSVDIGPEQNMTFGDPDVYTRASLNYMSPTTSAATVVTQNSLTINVDYRTPMTVTNSNPYSQLTNNSTWYGRGITSFVFKQPIDVGVSQNVTSDMISQLYPNPASGYAIFSTVVKQSGNFEINVLNAVGQVVKSSSVPATAGENKVRIDLSGLAEGIYFVKVKTGNESATKKLIVE